MMELSPVYSAAPAERRADVEQRVYDLLAQLNIPYTRVDHDTAHTMADCEIIGEKLGVDMCKNLLLTTRNHSVYFLLCMPGDKPFVTREFSKLMECSRLSFASEADLLELLGVTPGSASVLALMNDPIHRVQLVLDRSVAQAPWFGCHPCLNTSSLRLRTEDILHIFLPHTGHEPVLVDL